MQKGHFFAGNSSKIKNLRAFKILKFWGVKIKILLDYEIKIRGLN